MPNDPERAAIEMVNRRLEGFCRDGDSGGVASCYTDEAQLFPTGSEPIVGRAAIMEFWRGMLSLGLALQIETRETEFHGDTAVEIGRYQIHGTGALVDRGKYIVIWKKLAGAWKLHRDIWNSSLPARPS